MEGDAIRTLEEIAESELNRLRPLRERAGAEFEAAYRDCARFSHEARSTFTGAFKLLPQPQRSAMYAVYAFMRKTDDIVDSEGALADKRARIQVWRQSFDQMLAGRTDWPPGERWRYALQDTMERYEIPARFFHEVIDGAESDIDFQRYATFADLYRYCYKVASAVGLVCLHIWGAAGKDTAILGEWCGIAFQLTNILRDVRQDALEGRVYLPEDHCARFRVAPDDLKLSNPPQSVLDLIAHETAIARDYYRRSEPLFALVPPAGRAILYAMFAAYRSLLSAIERDPGAVFRGRVTVGWAKRVQIFLNALRIRYCGAPARTETRAVSTF